MVGKCFYYDFVVIIVLCFKGISQCVFFQFVSYGKCVDVICFIRKFWCNEVSEIVVSEVCFFGLLMQMVVDVDYMGMCFVMVDFNVIVYMVCWEQVYYVMWIQCFFGV